MTAPTVVGVHKQSKLLEIILLASHESWTSFCYISSQKYIYAAHFFLWLATYTGLKTLHAGVLLLLYSSIFWIDNCFDQNWPVNVPCTTKWRSPLSHPKANSTAHTSLCRSVFWFSVICYHHPEWQVMLSHDLFETGRLRHLSWFSIYPFFCAFGKKQEIL